MVVGSNPTGANDDLIPFERKIMLEEIKKKLAVLVHKRDHEKLTMQQALELGAEITELMIRQMEIEGVTLDLED